MFDIHQEPIRKLKTVLSRARVTDNDNKTVRREHAKSRFEFVSTVVFATSTSFWLFVLLSLVFYTSSNSFHNIFEMAVDNSCACANDLVKQFAG